MRQVIDGIVKLGYSINSECHRVLLIFDSFSSIL